MNYSISLRNKKSKKFLTIFCLLTLITSPIVSSAAIMSATAGGDRLFYAANPAPLDVDSTTGAFVQEVPIELPHGRNGLNPLLSLSYNNQNYHDGIFGFGWNISIPYIERINKNGIENLYTRNDFSSSQYGELVETNIVGTYRPRVDNGDFVKFVFSGNAWTVTDKQGTQYTYGTVAGSRLSNPIDASLVAKWMLEEVRDTNDNYIKYTYQKVDNQIYPASIVYTGHSTTDGIYAVTFTNEARPDPVFDYGYGFLIKTTQRVKQISVTASNTPVRSYALGYVSGNNGYRSMLHTVTETYINEGGSTATLSPWTFDYTNQAISFTSMAGNIAWDQLHFDRPAYVPIDLDGNGTTDVIVAGQLNDGRTFNDRYSGTGNGKFAGGAGVAGPSDIQEIWAYAGSAGYQSSDKGTRLYDINGDMFPDVIKSYVCSYFCGPSGNQTITTKQYYLNDGTGHWGPAVASSTLSTIFEETPGASAALVTKAIVGNVNGDIKQDIYPYETQYASSGQFGAMFIPNFAQLVDLNNDGLDDISVADTTSVKGILNTGGVVDPAQQTTGLSFQYPTTMVGNDGIDKGVRVVDINNDGLPDIIRSYSFTSWPASVGDGTFYPFETTSANEIWLNTGSGWIQMQNAPQLPLIANPYTTNGMWSGQEYLTEIFDRDGDGVADIGLNKTNAPRQDLLKKVTLPTGGTIEATFTPTTQQMTGTGLNHPKLPMTIWTLAMLVKNDGFGNAETISYTYKDGLMWFDGVASDRKFAGFGTVTETNAGGSTITYYHQANSTDTARGEFADSFAKLGKPYRTERYDTAGNLYSLTINKWDEATTPYGNTFVKLAQKVDLTYDGDATHRDKAETYSYDNATGNLVSKIELGQVAASGDGTFTDTGNDMRTTSIVYATGSSVGVVSAKSQEVVTNQSGAKVKEVKISYDNLLWGAVDKGNATKQESWKSGTSYAAAIKSYDTYGNVIQDVDPRGNSTSYTYDTPNLFVATTTDPLNHTTNYVYNYGIGKAKQVTDANGTVFQTVYDGRGRVLQELQPDPVNPAALALKASYAYVDTPLAGSTQKTAYLDGATTNTSYQYVDGFGRTIQTRTQSEVAETYATRDTVYNNRGLVWKESLSYFSSGVARTTPTGDVTLYTTYMYDTLGRVTSNMNAVGATTNAYDDWSVVTTDPNGNRKDYTRDAYNNLISVVEHNGAWAYTTTYGYNLAGDLVTITDALGNVRNFTYDGTGKRLSAEDLHAPSDTTFGVWSYSYDDAGNLIQRVDPNGQNVAYTYDALNRQLTENYTGQAGVETTYGYDNCTNGVGRVCAVTMLTGANTSYAYDKVGNIVSDTKVITGATYATLYIYDRQGNQSITTYPGGAQVRYTYNTAGLLDKIERKETGGVFVNVVSSIDYNPVGQVASQVDANGVTITNTYDATKLYRLSRKLTQSGSGNKVQDLNYTYDNLGSITQVIDASNTGAAKTVNYVYDGLNRMMSATATSTASGHNYAQVFSYDPIGNILTKNQTIDSVATSTYTYTYGGNLGTSYANPHAPTSLSISVAPLTEPVATSTVSVPVIGKLLVVGGGGGGGVGGGSSLPGGGGGAGGYYFDPSFSLASSSYAVTVGVGGAGSNSMYATGGNGGNSIFGVMTVFGGGGGGSTYSVSGLSGGSGGGGAGGGVPGTGSGSQGNTGGTGTGGDRAGGGGGANSAGGNGYWGGASYGGPGGGGASNSITGVSVVYAGGGGGSGANVGGSGGSGGGGQGQGYANGAPVSGVANTGGGGGGGSSYYGASGGSGVVIVSYPTGSLTATGGTITTFGTSTIHTFTSNGTFAIGSSGGSSSPSKVDFLLVGGGGGGAGDNQGSQCCYGGAGGGGQVATTSIQTLSPGSYPVVVGLGGAGKIGSGQAGTGGATTFNGGNSVSNGLTANGGLGANSSTSGVSGNGNAAGAPAAYSSGGGGGAGAPGSNAVWSGGSAIGGAGGPGQESSISGAPSYYGGGGGGGGGSAGGSGNGGGGSGGGGFYTNGGNAIPNTGGGGGGAGNANGWFTTGGNGGSGIVVISYPTGTLNATGGTMTSVNGNTIHTFTSDGVFVVATSTQSVGPTTATSTIAFSYDNAGNLLSQTGTNPKTYTWDYNSRMISSVASSTTDTYLYDHTGTRVSTQNSNNTTTYVGKYYTLAQTTIGTSTVATSTSYTFLGDTTVASTESINSGTPVTHYIHTDHLGSTNGVTDGAGSVVQTLDYYPYGETRVDSGAHESKRQFIGQYYDAGTSLSYLNARYYDGARGQFLSEDPVFWEVGMTKDGKNALVDPQALNSYAYAGGNPIIKSDPSGRNPALLVPLALFGIGFAASDVFQYAGDVIQNRQQNLSSPYAISSPVSDYLINGVGGGVSTVFLGAYKTGASLLAGATSIGQDMYTGRPLDIRKAVIATVGTYTTGSFFAGTAGKSALPVALSQGQSSLSSPGINLGLRYETSQAVFQNSAITAAQARYSSSQLNNAQTTTQSAPSASAQSSWVGSAVKSISSFISKLWK